MKPNDIIPKLQQWADTYRACNAQYAALRALTLCEPESPLCAAIWTLWERYTVALAETVGDADEWLLWYWLECGMGRRPKEATRQWSERARRVRTVRDLAMVICGR